MTKLPPSVGSFKNHEKVIDEKAKRLDLNSDIKQSCRIQTTIENDVIDLDDCERNNNHHISNRLESDSDDNNDDDFIEPMGYPSFLYDVNIEYSPGGNLSSSLSNKHCFKMKCLPYMVENDKRVLLGSSRLSIDNNDSTSDMIDCDRADEHCYDLGDEQWNRLSTSNQATPIDVTKETCAFLGNSDYVPNPKYKSRRVVLELVSAKLSQSNGYTIPPNASFTNLITLAEDKPVSSLATSATTSANSDSSSLRSSNGHSSTDVSNSDARSQSHFPVTRRISPSPPPPTPPPTSPTSSKKFVNYTILIKTIPGLDKFPAVIERRFSDFLSLYQGLKSNETLADIVDKNVSFPKKVYMGNFSLEKIAERSIEFTRLLHLCMSEFNLLWSVPFISFLIDKELKEAHRLSLFGDPDDVQALIETVYYIEQKLYMRFERSSRCSTSSNSIDVSDDQGDQSSPTLPNIRTADPNMNRHSETVLDSNVPTANHNDTSQRQLDDSETHERELGRNDSIQDASCGSSRVAIDRSILAPINQRILVTFCMLFITYCRTNNYIELKQVVRKFGRLIASQEYIDSLINTRHYNSLRACLLFLMNLTQGNVIDKHLRLQLKRTLEDIDGANADLNESLDSIRTEYNSRERNDRVDSRSGLSHTNDYSINKRGNSRIIKNDLTSLLRDRNFCLFQS